MSVNRFTRITPREYQPTYSPFPFEQVYTLLKDQRVQKQAQENQFDELQAKAASFQPKYGYVTRGLVDEYIQERNKRITDVATNYKQTGDISAARKGLYDIYLSDTTDPRVRAGIEDNSAREHADAITLSERYNKDLFFNNDYHDPQTGVWKQLSMDDIKKGYSKENIYGVHSDPGITWVDSQIGNHIKNQVANDFQLVKGEDGKSYWQNNKQEKLDYSYLYDKVDSLFKGFDSLDDALNNPELFSPEMSKFIYRRKKLDPNYNKKKLTDDVTNYLSLRMFDETSKSMKSAGSQKPKDEETESFLDDRASITNSGMVHTFEAQQAIKDQLVNSANPFATLYSSISKTENFNVDSPEFDKAYAEMGSSYYANDINIQNNTNKIVYDNILKNLQEKNKKGLLKNGQLVKVYSDAELATTAEMHTKNALFHMGNMIDATENAYNNLNIASNPNLEYKNGEVVLKGSDSKEYKRYKELKAKFVSPYSSQSSVSIGTTKVNNGLTKEENNELETLDKKYRSAEKALSQFEDERAKQLKDIYSKRNYKNKVYILETEGSDKERRASDVKFANAVSTQMDMTGATFYFNNQKFSGDQATEKLKNLEYSEEAGSWSGDYPTSDFNQSKDGFVPKGFAFDRDKGWMAYGYYKKTSGTGAEAKHLKSMTIAVPVDPGIMDSFLNAEDRFSTYVWDGYADMFSSSRKGQVMNAVLDEKKEDTDLIGSIAVKKVDDNTVLISGSYVIPDEKGNLTVVKRDTPERLNVDDAIQYLTDQYLYRRNYINENKGVTSIDHGLFQINDVANTEKEMTSDTIVNNGWTKGYISPDKMTADDNIEYAAAKFKTYGSAHWSATKGDNPLFNRSIAELSKLDQTSGYYDVLRALKRANPSLNDRSEQEDLLPLLRKIKESFGDTVDKSKTGGYELPFWIYATAMAMGESSLNPDVEPNKNRNRK